MRLKRLTLQGFKSFADRTDFDFDAGLSGVVGPNGCGKSNVVDAMKWVLGDQRPSSQRGSEMMDVVFHGAEGRPAMGHAEVLMVLEHDPKSDGAGDARVETTVGRRLFRSGESEYLLNDRVVRLKDVREAMLDTGLGVGAYSVMEQGKIDAVLSQNPDERRSIFDEAAGISRYKLRRKEALHRLDKTGLNLARVQDLRQEKATRVRSLKIQATRARSYRETRERLMALDVAVAFVDSGELRVRIDQLDADLEHVEQRVESLTADKDRARADLIEVETQARSLGDRQGELRDSAVALRGEERSRREATERGVQEVERLTQAGARAAEEHERVGESLNGAVADLEALKRQHDEVAKSFPATATVLEEKTRQAHEARRLFRQTHEEREDVRGRLLEAMQGRTRARNRVRDEELADRGFVARRERLQRQRDDLGARLATSVTEGEAERADVAALGLRAARVADMQRDHATRVDEGERQRDELLQRRHELASERSSIGSQLKLLDELETSHTGLDEAARELLASDRVVSRLVERIRCSLEVGPAVEAVLGQRVHGLLIEDFDRIATALDELAARKGGGQLALIDVGRTPDGNPPPASGAPPSAADVKPTGRPLMDYLRCPEPVHGLLQDALRGVVLVPDLGAARTLRATAYPPRVIVTLRGEVLDGAWVSAGVVEPAAGLLQRRSNLERLRAKQIAVDVRIQKATGQAASLDSVRERRLVQRVRLERARDALSEKCTGLEHRLKARESRERELATECEDVQAEFDELSAERIGCKVRMMAPLIDSWLLERKEAGLEVRQRDLNTRLTERDRQVHDTQDILSSFQSKKASLEAELEGLVERRDLLANSVAELRSRHQGLADEVEAAASERSTLETRIAAWAAEIADLSCRAAFLEDLNEQVADSTRELAREVEQQHEKAEAADEDLLRARDERSEAMLAQREAAVHLDGIDVRIAETWQLELSRLRGEISGRGLWGHGDVEGPPPPEGPVREVLLDGWIQGPPLPPDYWKTEDELPRLWESEEFARESAGQEIELLKTRMGRMGAVNPRAEHELHETQAEFVQLERDCIDLEEARKQLIEAIKTINAESRILFEETFEAARCNFQEIFRKLFQGGRADMQLIESDDPLDAGIDIFARPPGKELRSIRLLSGGERSLTALAILFAVFQVRPSPFCILDEVDAALDDANVERFLRVLSEFAKDTQFIVVTHHKRTMAECRVLYGVTMPRRGISTRMSVSLEQVETGEVDDVLEVKSVGLGRAEAEGLRAGPGRIVVPSAEPV